ncbi:MAG: FHA domain-containing protein [Verrucomicrobiota bacterium]|nr:FHA domain-containing protein [Verrucomicrobiota bacterium]
MNKSINYTQPLSREQILRPQEKAKNSTFLLFTYPEAGKNKYELNEESVVIGRSEGNIIIPSNTISRSHAKVLFSNGEYYIEDMNSTNGIYVNSMKVKRCVLRDGDTFQVGEADFVFVEEHNTLI